MRIDVAASLTVDSPAPATALLQVAVASPAEELLTVISGGKPLEPEEFEVDGARVHRLRLAAGTTTVAYTASVEDGGAGVPGGDLTDGRPRHRSVLPVHATPVAGVERMRDDPPLLT